MVGGILLGRLVPDLDDTLGTITIDTVSLPIAIGLLAMMYPVLAKVRYRGISGELSAPHRRAVARAQLGRRAHAHVRARMGVPR